MIDGFDILSDCKKYWISDDERIQFVIYFNQQQRMSLFLLFYTFQFTLFVRRDATVNLMGQNVLIYV